MIQVALAGYSCRKLSLVTAIGPKSHSRRPALLRHWLLLCVVAVLGQIGAPTLAWCLHDADRGAHLESALADCADHVAPHDDAGDMPCHNDRGKANHLMLDADTPGKVTPPLAAADAAAPPRFESRLSLDEWLPSATGLPTPAAASAAGRHHLPDIGQLVGVTTHLLI